MAKQDECDEGGQHVFRQEKETSTCSESPELRDGKGASEGGLSPAKEEGLLSERRLGDEASRGTSQVLTKREWLIAEAVLCCPCWALCSCFLSEGGLCI